MSRNNTTSTIPKSQLFHKSLADFNRNPTLYEVFDASKAQWIIAHSDEAFQQLPKDRQFTIASLKKNPQPYKTGWSTTIKHLQNTLLMSEPTDDPRYRKIHMSEYRHK